jgi:DNA-binding PadR family transcriptional regulator
VRKNFMNSPSPQWSGSAGAIYPLIKRLQARDFLRSRQQVPAGRRGRLYQLTPRGWRSLKEWLEPPLPDWVVGVPMDALRTRVGFFELLSPAGRTVFLEEARAKLQVHLHNVRQDCRRSRGQTDPFDYLVARGALAVLLAREAWLKDVFRYLESGELPADE